MVGHQYVGVEAVSVVLLNLTLKVVRYPGPSDRSLQPNVVAVEQVAIDLVAKLPREWEVR